MILAEVFKDKELHVCNLLQSNSAKKKKKNPNNSNTDVYVWERRKKGRCSQLMNLYGRNTGVHCTKFIAFHLSIFQSKYIFTANQEHPALYLPR